MSFLPLLTCLELYFDYWENQIKKNRKQPFNVSWQNPNTITLNHYNNNSFNESDYNTAVNFTNFIDGQPQQVYVERMGVFGANGTFKRG